VKPLFQNIAIVGLGLIGGSIALELKRKKLSPRIIGISRSAENRREALKLKAVDAAYSRVGSFLSEADLVILAAPVKAILPLLKNLKGFLKKDAMVTDVGSVKGEIVRAASRMKGFHFIGGHPIAGTERSGMKAAERDLFRGRKWILTPAPGTSKPCLKRLTSLIENLGARVVLMDPGEHDRIFSAVSHLPNVVAYALANAVASLEDPDLPRFAGSSLRDMTRVAGSPPEMWRDICLSNREEILRRMRNFEGVFGRLRKAVEKGNPSGLFKFFDQGRRFRKKLEAQRTL
jgi:prephenate dehydrogenase